MNIPELSTTLANMNLQNQVGVAVLSKALDSTEPVSYTHLLFTRASFQ